MILYATKQTIEELNIPMVEELSTFNQVITKGVIKEQGFSDFSEYTV